MFIFDNMLSKIYPSELQLNKVKDAFLDLHLSRTSDSLNEGLPIKMTREKFQRK